MRNQTLVKSLGRNVIALGLVSFFSDLSTETITPILPLFLVGVLGASYTTVGLIEGSADFLIGMLRVLSGWYSDKMERRKPFVTIGYTSAAFVKPLLAFAQTPLHVLGLRLAERAGKGIRGAPRDALVADSVDKSVLGRAFGFRSAMDTSGAVGGALLSLAFISVLAGNASTVYRTIFILSALPALVSATIAIFFVREVRKRNPQSVVTKSFSLGLRSFSPSLKFFLLTVSFFSLGNFSLAFFILRAKSLGIQDSQTISLFLMFNIVYALAALPIGEISDKIGRRKVITIGFAIFSAVCIGFAFSTNIVELAISFAAYGLFMAVYEGVPKAYISEISKEEYKATALGAVATVTAILSLASSLIGGFLWDSFGPVSTFTYGVAMGLIALALFGAGSKFVK